MIRRQLASTDHLISVIGFGIGFSVVLLASVGWFVFNAQKLMAVRSDGR